MSETLQYIGTQVKKLRIKKGLSREDLAAKSKITSNYLAQLERAEVNVSINKLDSLCQGLGLAIGDLFPTSNEVETKINSSIYKESIEEIVNIVCQLESKRDISLILVLLKEMNKNKK